MAYTGLAGFCLTKVSVRQYNRQKLLDRRAERGASLWFAPPVERRITVRYHTDRRGDSARRDHIDIAERSGRFLKNVGFGRRHYRGH